MIYIIVVFLRYALELLIFIGIYLNLIKFFKKLCYFDALSPYHTGKFDLNLHFYLQRLVCLHLLSSMQYKFFVDGEWRHDENQPFISCTYGMVNTVLLARESDYIPPPMSTAVSSLTNMDVDNEAFQQLVGASYT